MARCETEEGKGLWQTAAAAENRAAREGKDQLLHPRAVGTGSLHDTHHFLKPFAPELRFLDIYKNNLGNIHLSSRFIKESLWSSSSDENFSSNMH